MPTFGKRSEKNLSEAHPKLQKIAREVIKHYDFAVLCGYRTDEEQERLYHEGKTKLRAGQGMHNRKPSQALDVAPYPIDWDSPHALKKFSFLAGLFFGVAQQMGIRLRWGGDWDGDGQMRDQRFHDLPHIELHRSEK